MKKKKKIPDNQIAVHQTPEGGINIEKNIYKEKELDELSTAEVFSVVQIEGKREITRSVTYYSLEAARHQQGKYNEKQFAC